MIFRITGIAYMERNEEEAYVRCVENLVIPWIFEHKHLRPISAELTIRAISENKCFLK